MAQKLDILLCGTSAQGQSLSHDLAALGHHVTSLAGQSARVPPETPPIDAQFDLIIDAAHPFDQQAQSDAVRIATLQTVPLWRIDRPKWDIDHYGATQTPDMTAALNMIASGATVFVATGYEDVDACAAREDLQIYMRQIRKTRPARGDHIRFLDSDPPFEVSQEVALLASLNATHLIIRNAGGDGARPKLDAARELGLTILFIAPPDRTPHHGEERVFASTEQLVEALNGSD